MWKYASSTLTINFNVLMKDFKDIYSFSFYNFQHKFLQTFHDQEKSPAFPSFTRTVGILVLRCKVTIEQLSVHFYAQQNLFLDNIQHHCSSGDSQIFNCKAPVPLSRFRRRKRHGFDPGLTVIKLAYFRHGYDSPTVELRCDNGATMATTDNLRLY